jgi:hypothetical protein
VAAFFALSLAPGITLSASGRGLRAHIGARAARLQIAGTRLGMASGPGSVTYYQAVSAGGRTGGWAYPMMAGSPSSQRPNKGDQARIITEALDQIANMHRRTFVTPPQPRAPRPMLPPFRRLVDAAEADELKRVSIFKRSERLAARRRAYARAHEQAQQLIAQAHEERQAVQAELDAKWRALNENDPDTVLAMLALAFGDNDAPVAPIGVDGSEVSLVVRVPQIDVIPDRMPTITHAGNMSLPKMSKAQTNDWYRTLVAGHILASVKEAFAIAPGLSSARVVAVRDDATDRHSIPSAVPLLCARISRSQLSRVYWETVDAWDVLIATSTDTLMALRGSAKELKPLDLDHEPDLQRVVDAFSADRA